jgi:hypothetical protein
MAGRKISAARNPDYVIKPLSLITYVDLLSIGTNDDAILQWVFCTLQFQRCPCGHPFKRSLSRQACTGSLTEEEYIYL